MLGIGLAVACVGHNALGNMYHELLTLFDVGDGTAPSDYEGFMDRFEAIIADPTSVAPATLHHLLTDSFGRGTDATLGKVHLLYWLDKLLKLYKTDIGYDVRLSEAGATWGAEEPDSITEADPLGLIARLESTTTKVIIIDSDCKLDGTNNTAAGNVVGCVRLDRNVATAGVLCIDNVTPKSNANRFSGSDYVHKLFYTLNDFNERNGGGVCFPNSTTVESIALVRATLSKHTVESENQIGIRIETQTVAISGTPTGGTYTLTSSNFGTTGPINWNASSADVQAALRLLPDLSEVTVTTSAGSVPNITHLIAFHGITTVANPATLTSTSSLTGGTPVINHVATQTGGGQNTQITLRGYPGEWPEVYCGNSTDSDVTPGECPNSGLIPNNGTATMFRIGQTSTQYRSRFHIRNIHWHGKRVTAGGNFIYCGDEILRFTYGKDCSIRHCKFTDLNPLPNNDHLANRTATPNVIDWANSIRTTWVFNGVAVAAPGMVVDSNWFEGAPKNGFPNAANSAVATILTSDSDGGALRFNCAAAHNLTSGVISISGHRGFTGNTKLGKFTIDSVTATTITTTAAFSGTGGIEGTIRVPPIDGRTGEASLDVSGANVIVTRNRFTGSMGVPVRVDTAAGTLIEDNIIESFDGTCLYLRNSSGSRVRRNRIGPHGTADYAVSTASHGIQVGYCTDVIIEYNVIYTLEPSNNVASFGVWIKAKDTSPTTDIKVRRNLVYRSGLHFDNDQYAAATVSGIEFTDNMVIGMAELHKNKQTAEGEIWLNAPMAVTFINRTGDVAGTLNGLVSAARNRFWRFENATPLQTTVEPGAMLVVRNQSAEQLSDYYDVEDELEGWEDNVVERPAWQGDPEAASPDFRLLVDPIGFVAGTPLTEALSQAWVAV